MTDGFVAVTWVVEHAKITRYLLDLSHKEGGSKAKYLLALGFTPDDPETLASALVRHALAHMPGRHVDPPIGLRRVIFEGETETPDGRSLSICAVWELTTLTEIRLITVVPLTK
ncbi:DUF6883 domain-containing protein [Methylobacterium sp. WL9]|uniref:DUF6883 domain-containing protein n=1 Tax=Methylobacterium sp. WL9 TaxID=2603898 RepID=UPI0011C987F8|nr:DUF6883 domain-containing protein [Methylobacterium sp. WL9]TXN21809.1 hypothetical protein FV217_12965 [Methylobacterium sp. WL9]